VELLFIICTLISSEKGSTPPAMQKAYDDVKDLLVAQKKATFLVLVDLRSRDLARVGKSLLCRNLPSYLFNR